MMNKNIITILSSKDENLLTLSKEFDLQYEQEKILWENSAIFKQLIQFTDKVQGKLNQSILYCYYQFKKNTVAAHFYRGNRRKDFYTININDFLQENIICKTNTFPQNAGNLLLIDINDKEKNWCQSNIKLNKVDYIDLTDFIGNNENATKLKSSEKLVQTSGNLLSTLVTLKNVQKLKLDGWFHNNAQNNYLYSDSIQFPIGGNLIKNTILADETGEIIPTYPNVIYNIKISSTIGDKIGEIERKTNSLGIPFDVYTSDKQYGFGLMTTTIETLQQDNFDYIYEAISTFHGFSVYLGINFPTEDEDKHFILRDTSYNHVSNNFLYLDEIVDNGTIELKGNFLDYWAKLILFFQTLNLDWDEVNYSLTLSDNKPVINFVFIDGNNYRLGIAAKASSLLESLGTPIITCYTPKARVFYLTYGAETDTLPEIALFYNQLGFSAEEYRFCLNEFLGYWADYLFYESSNSLGISQLTKNLFLT